MKSIIPYLICFISIVATIVSVQEMSCRIGNYFSAHMDSLNIEGDIIIVWDGKMIVNKHFSNEEKVMDENDYNQYLSQRYSPKMAEYLKKDFYFMFLKT